MRLKLVNDNWVQAEEKDKDTFYIDGFLKSKLDNVLILQEKNYDCAFIIVGKEGSGKSTLAFICGDYLTKKKLTMDHLVAGSEDALKKLQDMPDGSLLICDEGELLFSSRETMSTEQRQLTKVMKVIRQKRMILIIVTPTYFDLSKYIAVDRPRFVIRVYTDNKLNRGFFSYWGEKKLNKLYTLGKKFNNSYSRPKAQFNGRFIDYRPSFDKDYREIIKKKSLSEAFITKEDKKAQKKKEDFIRRRNELIVNLKKTFPNLPVDLITKTFDVEASTVYTVLRKNSLENAVFNG